MQQKLLGELYRQLTMLPLKSFSPSLLSHLLRGYLSLYSAVQIKPWLEEDFEGSRKIHERVREMARIIRERLKGVDLQADVRAGSIADLMNTYLLYSDIDFLDVALDEACRLLIPDANQQMVLPCRTPNVCRLLCNYYYFTGEENSVLLARGLVVEAFGLSPHFNQEELEEWHTALRVYESIIGGMDASQEEQEQLRENFHRLYVRVEQLENEKITAFQPSDSLTSTVEVFDILAQREYLACHESYKESEFI